MSEVFEAGDEVILDYKGQKLEGVVYSRTFVGPSVTDYVYIVEVEGWIGNFNMGAHQLKHNTTKAYDRAMKGI